MEKKLAKPSNNKIEKQTSYASTSGTDEME